MRIGLLNDPNNFHTQKWAKALENAGAHVTVFSFDPDQGSGLRTRQVPVPGGGPGYNYRAYLRGGPALREALQAERIDLVNALNITPFGVWASKSGFHPWIGSAMGADILEYGPRQERLSALQNRSWSNIEGRNDPFTRLMQGMKRHYFRKMVRYALREADFITGDNHGLVKAMRTWFQVPETKSRVLRWGVEPELFQAEKEKIEAVRKRFRIPENSKVVLSPRGAKAIYQADIILEAIAKRLESGKDELVHYIVLGAGYRVSEQVVARAAKLQQRYDNFIFVAEMVPREDIYALWNLVDVFISAPIYDGYSAIVAEGRYAGAVPILNNIPANLEVVRHLENGWIVQPFNAIQLSKDLGKVLDQLMDYQPQFAARSKIWIEENSLVKKNAQLFLEICQEIVKT